MKLLLILGISLCILSCSDATLPELDPNLLAPGGPPNFTLVGTQIIPTSETRSDVVIAFSSLYPLLNELQREKILGINVNGGTGIRPDTLPADETSVTLNHLRRGQPYVITLQFLTENTGMPVTEIHITP